MTRLLIIDDHEVVRQGLVLALKNQGFESIETAGNILEARGKIAVFNPQGIIVDINLPDGSGFEIVQWVRTHSQNTAIIVLSLNNPVPFAKAAQQSGANAYLSKSQSVQEIIATLEFALLHPNTFTSTVAGFDLDLIALTGREIDVLHLMAKGFSNLKISSTLYISLATVKTHISSIIRKLDATNRTSAITIAREKGLLL
jgi:DNA-binding NarL/FixJ family response regulator